MRRTKSRRRMNGKHGDRIVRIEDCEYEEDGEEDEEKRIRGG